jgi:hypothetical protein
MIEVVTLVRYWSRGAPEKGTDGGIEELEEMVEGTNG